MDEVSDHLLRDENKITVPFRLDNDLGPNRIEVLLIMTRFSIDLSGQFIVAVSENTFQVTGVDIRADPFDLAFAEDFQAHISDLRIEPDTEVETMPGTIVGSSNQGGLDVSCEVPVRVHMLVHLQGISEWITFKTPFQVAGTIQRNLISLQGRFSFRMDGYSESRMPPKYGSCEVMLNASSVLQFQLVPGKETNRMRLAFAGRQAELFIDGKFTVGLDGLDIRVLDLLLVATPLEFPNLLSTDEVRVLLDPNTDPVEVDFRLSEGGKYAIQAVLPTQLTTQLTFLGFKPQPFEAALALILEGYVALEETLQLNLHDHVEVSIGDGTIGLEVEARLEAEPTPLSKVFDERDSERRALYAALKAVPDGPYGDELAPLQDALETPDRTARLLAVHALTRRSNGTGLPLLVASLRDSAPEVRSAAASALADLGGSQESSALLDCFERDMDDSVRLAALISLGKMDSPTWLEAAHTAITDSNEVLRCQAALIMGQRGGVASTGRLFEALSDPNPFVRLCAGMGLLTAGQKEAIGTIASLTEEEEDVCLKMLGGIALGQVQDDVARSTLQNLLETSQDVFVQRAVIYGLTKQEGGTVSS